MDMDQAIEDLSDLRGKVLRNEEIEPEEYKIIMDNLRVSRMAGEATVSRKKTEAKEASAARGTALLAQMVTGKSG